MKLKGTGSWLLVSASRGRWGSRKIANSPATRTWRKYRRRWTGTLMRSSQRWRTSSENHKGNAANLPPSGLPSTTSTAYRQPTKPRRSFLSSKSTTKPATRARYLPYRGRLSTRLPSLESRMKASRRARKANRRAGAKAKAEAKKQRNRAGRNRRSQCLLINLPSPKASFPISAVTRAFWRSTLSRIRKNRWVNQGKARFPVASERRARART